MAITNFEQLDLNTDVTTTRTLLHESIPLTGTIYLNATGAYSDNNIKNFTHGMFQSVYDYPYLSSSANHIFDITVGYDEDSDLSGSSSTQNAKKINMYNEFSQTLLGYTGSNNRVRRFELDTVLDSTGSCQAGFFLNFSRLITKDQIKKGTFSITLGAGAWASPFSQVVTLTDASASENGGTLNTLGGDYGLLYDTGSFVRGLVFYQAGVAFLSTSSFGAGEGGTDGSVSTFYMPAGSPVGPQTLAQVMTGSAITGACDAARHRIQNISFNNTTEINSTIYFCRVPHNRYNHSANPTYLSSSQIRVKSVASDSPLAFITTVGLYDSNNELLAVAKLSEPLRKDPTNEITLRVRLDY